jgi:hypothetical protein
MTMLIAVSCGCLFPVLAEVDRLEAVRPEPVKAAA